MGLLWAPASVAEDWRRSGAPVPVLQELVDLEELTNGFVQNCGLDTPRRYLRRMTLDVPVDPW